MTEYTPSTAQVRDAYVRAMRNAFLASTSELIEEFDRWRAETNRKIAEEAWDEALQTFGEIDLHDITPFCDVADRWFHEGIDQTQDEAIAWASDTTGCAESFNPYRKNV